MMLNISIKIDIILFMSFTILIVDDEIKICLTLSEILQKKNYNTFYCTNPLEVVSFIKMNNIDLLLIDVKMPELNGIDLLKTIKGKINNIPIIMISGFATVDNVVSSMKYGALNFLTKPINNQKLVKEIEQIANSKLLKVNVPFNARIITQNTKMLEILRLAEKVAQTNASVVITGESGTGKELIADLIHQQSQRKDKPFIKINCAAVPETLLESELFGHERGAFTDAKNLKQGQFELAQDGSIFLDEIGDMSLKIQAKMLRVLQEKKFTRIGGSKVLDANFRIIAATNRDLHKMIKEGLFREDLFYRLSVITLHLPPLRERKDDLSNLAKHFLNDFNQMYNKGVTTISDDVKDLLHKHTWPGNIRELKNLMERVVIFSEENNINLSVIPEQYKSLTNNVNEDTLDIRYKSSTKDIIVEALEKSKGIKQKAAELLKIDRKTLYRQMKKYNIDYETENNQK